MGGEKQDENITENNENGPHKSFELVTDDLIKKALLKDKGSDSELLSWEIIPFTNKGDNYSSIVTSIAIRYRLKGEEYDHSYIAKLNPLRPVTFFSDIMEKGYTRETQVLSEIVEGMNNQLKKLGLDPIRAPKLYAHTLEKGKEAFITENFRIQGFKMYDRMKGMDLNHAMFVVQELGRFHASSLLFEDTLPSKSLPETFNSVKGAWLDLDEEGIEKFGEVYTSYGEVAGNFLKDSDPKYEKCSKWLLKNANKLVHHYKRGFEPRNNFDVLIHGDCWTNNMLFKYNEYGIPVDFRFVDLQCSARASATSDLNYYFYTSLTGDCRRKNLNTLITAYYESFSRVMKRAGKEPPFYYMELKKELNQRKVFGLAAGILVLQVVLAQGDEIPDMENFTEDNMDEFKELHIKNFHKMSKRGGVFKDRYIAMFDDMLNISLFDED